ncbi:hypothetical protein BDF20DRAFT_843235 [Mycotypha africana]|uniref:uncharacterized protein n=1 Tax=Mycotypha africana TaxID=64632 RepID=UPI0023005C53|nr:uncharacterized protein BDF20DRAFT_843235 [Mycotypha africana]KAI8991194.1 hypothetical protein BDF20DRAFT_843235 [Mycotypha africana]
MLLNNLAWSMIFLSQQKLCIITLLCSLALSLQKNILYASLSTILFVLAAVDFNHWLSNCYGIIPTSKILPICKSGYH